MKPDERAAYITRCESDIAASKEKITEQERKQRAFKKDIEKCLDDIVRITNRPLLELIDDITRLSGR